MEFQIVFSFLLAVLPFGYSHGGERKPSWGVPRIIGGKDADANEFPYTVSLELNGSHHCGGVIIDNAYIVTAAHCVDDFPFSALSIRAGSIQREAGGQVVGVSNVCLHPDYDSNTVTNDIAVVELTTSLTLGESVKKLPMTSVIPPTGAEVTVVGWGITEEGVRADRLQYTKMNATLTKTCQHSNDSNILCLLNEGSSTVCKTDSGSPAIYQGKVVGVLSFGSCSTLHPAGYTAVPKYMNWVMNTISNM